ncbi:MAG: 6-bladed beta-propeller [Acidobacteriota bacterium]|nr:6-bladed beta-propeller [Acidobacteriota bacterium]MDW3228290.1 6-bladed beta-propeller [Acidobacteriota bacterium]MDY0230885.1 6-bladed beta-propeller [Candidatus Saccharicenans sp.]
MRKLAFISAVLIFSNLCFAWDIKFIKKIPVEDGVLFNSAGFVVLEDGNFLFTDFKDKENQIKIFNEDGKLIRAWGKMGPGPDEFGGLGFLDYQKPYLAVADAGRHRISVFEKLKNYEFKKIGDILAWEQEGTIKIYQKNILMHGYIVSPEGKKYKLFMRDWSGRKTEYILPIEHDYGAKSMSEYQKIKEELDFSLPLAFMDIYEDTLFYVRDVRLRVVKIDLKSKKIGVIGKEPKNFRVKPIDKKTKKIVMDRQNPKGKELLEEIVTKRSFASGLFAGKDFVAVIYVNREKKIDGNPYWIPYIQIYDHSGQVLHEQSLAPFFSEDRLIPLYYLKDKGLLYLCSITSSEAAYQYEIYKYSVEQ